MYILTSRETEKIQITQTISNHRTPTKITKAKEMQSWKLHPFQQEGIHHHVSPAWEGGVGGVVGMVRIFWFYNDKIYLIPQ